MKDNEASSWLPGVAGVHRGRSTKLSKTVNPNDIPTLVVYNRAAA